MADDKKSKSGFPASREGYGRRKEAEKLAKANQPQAALGSGKSPAESTEASMQPSSFPASRDAYRRRKEAEKLTSASQQQTTAVTTEISTQHNSFPASREAYGRRKEAEKLSRANQPLPATGIGQDDATLEGMHYDSIHSVTTNDSQEARRNHMSQAQTDSSQQENSGDSTALQDSPSAVEENNGRPNAPSLSSSPLYESRQELLQARMVEEPTIVRAEPVAIPEIVSQDSEEDKANEERGDARRRGWLEVGIVLVLVLAGILVAVFVSRSRASSNNDSSPDVNQPLFPDPSPPSPTPLPRPTLKPTAWPTARPTLKPTSAPTTAGPTVTPGSPSASPTLPPVGTICTNVTITYRPDTTGGGSQGATKPSKQELQNLETVTIAFFNQTMAAGFPGSFIRQVPTSFTDKPASNGWTTIFLADQIFAHIPTTDEVVPVIETADYESFIIDEVIQTGPYFQQTIGLDLVAGECVKNMTIENPTTTAPTTAGPTVTPGSPSGSPTTTMPTGRPTRTPTRKPTRKPTSAPTDFFSPTFSPRRLDSDGNEIVDKDGDGEW